MSAKKGKKSKGTTLSLQEFNSRLEDKAPAAGQNVIYAPKKKPGQMTSWADEVEDDDYYEKERILLPSAPRAVRGPAYDDSEIPREPPFSAHLGNLSYDINDEDVYKFFRDLEVVDLRLPRDGNSNRLRGFGHVEFSTRQDLVEALIRNEQMLMGRPVRVTLGSNNANRNDDNRRGDRPDRGGGYSHQDETPDDWRSTMSAAKPDSYDSYGGPPSNFGRRDRGDQDRPRRDFDRREMYGSGGGGGGGGRDGGSRSDVGRDIDDYGRRGRDDRGRDDRGPRDRSYEEEEGPTDWRSSMRPATREPPHEDFVRSSHNPPSRMDMEPPFERRPPSEDRHRRPSEREEESEPSKPEPPRERKKLVIAPRTVPVPPGESAPGETAARSIFGEAKPVDTASREREIEEKLAQVTVKPPKQSPPPREPTRERERSHDEPPKQFRILKRPQSSEISMESEIHSSSEFEVHNKPTTQGRRSQPLRLGEEKPPKSIHTRPDRDRQISTSSSRGSVTEHASQYGGGPRSLPSHHRGGFHPVPPAPGQRRKSDSDEGDHEDDRGSRHDIRQQRDRDTGAPPAVNPWSRARQPPEHDNYRRDVHGSSDRKTPDSDRNGEKEKDSHSEPEDDRDIRETREHHFIGEKTYEKGSGGDEDFRRVERRDTRDRDNRDWSRNERSDRGGDRDGGRWHNSGPRRDGRSMEGPRRGGDGRGFDDRRSSGLRDDTRSSGLRDNRDRENSSRDNRRVMDSRDYRGDIGRGGDRNRMERGGYNSMDRNTRGGRDMPRGPRGGGGRMGSRDDYYSRDSEGFQESRGPPPRNLPKHVDEKQPIVPAKNKFCVLGDQDDVGSD